MNKRGSGILLHITSLPSAYGIGDLGPAAWRFADFLAEAKQSYWQILPLTPTESFSGNSPYSCVSAFAGNPLLISPELLVESGFLRRGDFLPVPAFAAQRCDFEAAVPYRMRLLMKAHERFKADHPERQAYERFCLENASWLDDFALFVVVKKHCGGKAWSDWDPDLRDRDPESLRRIQGQRSLELEREKFYQYLFFRQWLSLKAYCRQRHIRIIGDLPIYVNHDSADVWANPELFKLDREKKPLVVAGVPPDYFSETGQRWGNPIYRWEVLEASGYQWWMERIAHNLRLFDFVRIDHFRGFVGFWEIPAVEQTAINGRWVEGPGVSFFMTLFRRFPEAGLIAEDLGLISPDVIHVMNRFGLPGMRVIQFAFAEDDAQSPHLPHNYVPNCLAFTGTHDNNTLRGWFDEEITPEERERVFLYLGRQVCGEELPRELIRLLMMSVAKTVIVQAQDILGLGSEARMNLPSTCQGNWTWRLMPDQLSPSHAQMLSEMSARYGRASGQQPAPAAFPEDYFQPIGS